MKIVNISISVDDHKYRHQSTFNKVALTIESAVEYLKSTYGELTDVTNEFITEHPFIEEKDLPAKLFKFTKTRVDDDGDWDYPTEYQFTLQWEEVIE